MDELIALVIVAACARQQEELVKQLAFAKLDYDRWVRDINLNPRRDVGEIEFAERSYNQIQGAISTLVEIYDQLMASFAVKYDIDDWDDADLCMTAGFRVSKNHPAVNILCKSN